MSDDDDYLRAIIARPDDDAPRLTYAHWLESLGDPRGEFVRVQCELAKAIPNSAHMIELAERSAALLHEFQKEWAGPLAEFKVAFHRGFIQAIDDLLSIDFLAIGEDFFALAPIKDLSIVVCDDLPDVLATPWLSKLKALRFIGLSDGDEDAARIASTATLANLEQLELQGNGIGRAGAIAILKSETLSNLRIIDLSRDGEKMRVACREYESPDKSDPRCSSLNMNHVQVGPAGLVEALAQVRMNRFRAIDLYGCSIGDDGTNAIAECSALSELELLNLGSNGLTDSAALALANSPHLKSLRLLFCGMNPFDGIGEISIGGRALTKRFGDGAHFFIF